MAVQTSSNPPFIERTHSQRYYARRPSEDHENTASFARSINMPPSTSAPADHLKLIFQGSNGYDGNVDEDISLPRGVDQPSQSVSQSRSYAARARARGGQGVNTSTSGSNEALQRSPMTSPTDRDHGGFTDSPLADQQFHRRESVPDRSPLQKLEVSLGDKTKEEKRARAEHAEERARASVATRRSDGLDIQRSRGELETNQEHLITRKPVNAGVAETTRRSTRSDSLGNYPDKRYSSYGSNENTYPSGNRPNPSRSNSREYGHDANLSGGAAAAAVNAYLADRSLQHDQSQSGPDYTYANGRQTGNGHYEENHKSHNSQNRTRTAEAQQNLHSARMGDPNSAPSQDQEDDFLSRDQVRAKGDGGTTYVMPPQTAAGVRGRQQVGFGNVDPQQMAQQQRDTREVRFEEESSDQRNHTVRRHQTARNLDDWRNADTATLVKEDLNMSVERNSESSRTRDSTRHRNKRHSASSDTTSGSNIGGISPQTIFKPALTLRCGPLLRYTGLRRGSVSSQGTTTEEFWKGSIMIVTEDTYSSYERAPVLRLYKQPMQLLATSSSSATPSGAYRDSEQQDDFAGQLKVSRTGEILLVRPPYQLQSGLDLSHVETSEGLFERMLTSDQVRRTSARISQIDGEKTGGYREVRGFRLHAERGVTFWRFNIEIELTQQESRIAYRINNGPPIAFWVPAKGQNMHIMFHSCNGFSMSVNPNEFCGPDPMWRDVLRSHQQRPFHVMIGGGDQIYNDAAMQETEHFQKWLALKDPNHKHGSDFTIEMQNDLEEFYLNRYAMWFSQGLFSMANAQIPMVNMWDDHDIMDGFGSYPHHFMSTPVFSGLGTVAFKYYMLFQHQSVVDESQMTEPSWLLGASPGPYINQLSRSLFVSLGSNVSLLAVDCRTERMFDEILSQESWDLIFDRCHHEVVKGVTKHLIVLLGVPIAYPRFNFAENILTSRAMGPIKALGRKGMFGGFLNKFDGSAEILDDLNDHWTAKHHKDERNWFVQELQHLAIEKNVRVTFLSGDVHLAAVGQFYSKSKLGIAKDRDHRYMPNVISSAIVNTPPPDRLADFLNKRNKIHHMDDQTDEDMIPLFAYDIDGSERSNHTLLPRRNWCSIKQYEPGFTPPPTPPMTDQSESRNRSTSRSRRELLTRRDPDRGNLLRRSSNRGAPPTSFRGPEVGPYSSRDIDPRVDGPQDSDSSTGYNDRGQPEERLSRAPQRTNSFRRRPSRSSQRAAEKDSTGREGYIDLHGGLDITIHCETNQKDPAGRTAPYRLLVPALFPNVDSQQTNEGGSRRNSFLGSLFRSGSKKRRESGGEDASYMPNDRRNSFTPDQHEGSRNLDGARPSEYENYGDNNRGVAEQNTMHRTQNLPNTPFHTPQAQVKSPPEPESQPNLTTLQSLPRSGRPLETTMPRQSLDDRQGRSSSRDRFNSMMYNTTQGPPPPRNIDQLPASVQKRYSQFSEPDPDEQHDSHYNSNRDSHFDNRRSSDDPPLGRVNNEYHNYSPEQTMNGGMSGSMTERRVASGPPSAPIPYRVYPQRSFSQSKQTHNNDDALPFHDNRALDVPQRAVSWDAPQSTRCANTSQAAPLPLGSSPTTHNPSVFQPQPQRQRYQSLTRDEYANNEEPPPGSPAYQIRYPYRGILVSQEQRDAQDQDDDGQPQSQPVQRSSKLARHFGASNDTGRQWEPVQMEQAPEKRGRGLGSFMRRLSTSGNRDGQKFKAGW